MKPIARIGLLMLCSFAALAQAPEQAPAPPKPPAPPPPKNQAGSSTYEETESIWSLSVFYWRPRGGDALLAGGKLSPDPPAQTIELPGKPKGIPGVILTIPTGRSNRIEISGWESRASGSTTVTRDSVFFGTLFEEGEFLTTQNRIRNLKFSWNYLSFPYPPLDSKFRLKTLWEVQYVQSRPVITAPFTAEEETEDSPALPAIQVVNKRSIILPTLGLGIEWIPSAKHFRMEAKGSAMAFPGKSQIWDTEGSAVLRLGNLEIFGGAKLFHFRTSPSKDQYIEGNLWGPMAGVRWVFR